MSENRPTANSVPHPLERASRLYGQGRWAEAEQLCRAVLARVPEDPAALSLLGIMLAQTRRTPEAAQVLERAAAVMPDRAEAHINHGNVLRTLGRYEDALACYGRALALAPDNALAHYNRGLTFTDQRRYEQAIESYDRAVALKPDYAAAWNDRGAVLHERGRRDEALASIERAIALQPGFPAAHGNRGLTLRAAGRLEAALESFDRALALLPNSAVAHIHRGDTLHALGRFEEAVASYDRALALSPADAETHARRGATLTSMERYAEALASCDRALGIDLRCANAYTNRGAALYRLKRYRDALRSLDQAIGLGQRRADTYQFRGMVLQELGGFFEAIRSYAQALAIDPGCRFLRGNHRHARMQICDWEDFETDTAAISTALGRGETAATPFVLLSLIDSPELQRRAADICARDTLARAPRTAAPRHPRHDRIRIGYFSADLGSHAVALLAAGLFEAHDRCAFELIAFSLGPPVSDELGARARAASDRFLEVDAQADRDIVALARRLEIDIAVDLGGYTRDARPGIMALRAAPVQVGYLGYLGTLGEGLLDYLLADPVLIPRESAEHYSEKIAYLPSYQVNDAKRPVADREFTRAELGLPPTGFVFCCFNNPYKITPETFDSWMRILSEVPDSVLFLLGGSPVAERNLRREAVRRGVQAERLVFGGVLSMGEYLARYRVADLFLDTLPYNAGTTASDALWAGLPVLTLPGASFASRMAASILTAARMPELIASGRADYERRAIELATSGSRIEELKRKLAANRGRCALFDTMSFARGLESLYRQMYERHLAGASPEHLFS